MGETIRLMTFESDKQNIYEVSNQILIDRDITVMTAPSWHKNRKKALIKIAQNSYVNKIFRFITGSAKRFSNKIPRLKLVSVSFMDSSVVDFHQHNGILEIEDCFFGNVQESVVTGQFSKLTQASIRIDKTVFENCGSILNVLDIALRPHFNTSLDFTVIITDSIVRSTPGYFHHTAGLLINIANEIKRFNLTVVRTQFLYLTQALLVHTHQVSNVEFRVSNSVFRNNFFIRSSNLESVVSFTDCIYCTVFCGAAIKYKGKGLLNITDSQFVNNTSNKGGAVCLDGPNGFFNNVTFNNNKAIEYGGAMFIYLATARITSSQFMLNSASWKVKTTGKNKKDRSTGIGGALYCNGDVTITKSQFVHNCASIFGGSILHNGERLKLISNMFVGPRIYEDTSLHGSILYTKAQCSLIDNNFYSVSANSQGSVIFHSSDNIELIIKPKFTLTCNRGERLIRSFNHQPGKTEFSLLMFICKPCSDGQYSLEQEMIFLNNSQMESDVLLTCKKCPQGGVCENGIKSVPNFWGWKTLDGKSIKFLPCPSSTYCCSPGSCIGYDSCDLNRVGRLCGKCREGYGESVLSSVCVPNESCNGNILWPFVVITGCCYVVLLLYFKDIFSYIKLLVLKPFLFIQKLQTITETTDLDELDNFYVDLGNTETNPDGLIIRHDMLPNFIIENDESSMMRPDEDLDDNSVNFDEDIGIINDEFYSDSITERLLSSNYNTNTISPTRERTTSTVTTATNAVKITPTFEHSKQKKIKWYSHLFGIFKIIVFFYQMQLLSKVPSVLESSYEFQGPRFLKEFVTGIFNLKLTGSYFSFHLCMIKDLEPIFKRFLKIFFVLSLFVILALFYLSSKLILKVKTIFSIARHDREHNEQKHRLPLSIRVKCCLVQIFLLGFSTITTASFELLHCVTINGVNYSYINATAECNRGWYTCAKVLTAVWTLPFVFALFFANQLLREEKIHLNEFLFMLVFPPSFLYYTARNKYRENRKILYTQDELQARDHVLQVLEMPFKKKKKSIKSIWYWETMLIARRLILISVFVFFEEPISRLYVMFLPLTLFLVDHLRVQPYNHRLLNWMETGSLLGLVFLISINLFWAYNYETNVPANDQLDLISHIFLYVETFILLLPLFTLIVVIVVAASGTILKKVRRKRKVSKGL